MTQLKIKKKLSFCRQASRRDAASTEYHTSRRDAASTEYYTSLRDAASTEYRTSRRDAASTEITLNLTTGWTSCEENGQDVDGPQQLTQLIENAVPEWKADWTLLFMNTRDMTPYCFVILPSFRSSLLPPPYR